jgi:UDP-N-acetylmuramoyl-tripeptide--D-alanyl-D-alanine ligase
MSTAPLWTIAEIARALGVSSGASGDFPATAIGSVTQDSRLVKPGTLFVALSGTPSGGFVSNFASARDGWAFAANAQGAGAAAMIVPHRIDGISVPQLVVKDTLIDGLWALARVARARFAGPVIGLTGSAGKSSTKELIAAYPGAYANPSSFNNFWGVPLTLCNADPQATLWVVEMGMSEAGEIWRLSELTQPSVAMVVNVKPVHLEKLGTLVLPEGLEAGDWNGSIVRFGETAEVRELSHQACGESWDVRAEVRGKELQFSLAPGAPHRVQNALAALAAIDAAGLDATKLAAELGHVGIMTGRGLEQTAGGALVIDDSYNGNPASMAAALESLKARCPVADGRRIAIIGDMLELGAEAKAYHEELVKHLPGIDGVYCVGSLMRHLFDRLPEGQGLGWHEEPATLDPSAIARLLRRGDVVVVKGSKKIFWVNKFVPRLVAALQAST